jgi:hypothetical protein
MKLASISLIAIFALLPAIAADSQSLADLANKERERRAKITAETKVITNDDSEKYKDGPITTGTLPSKPSAEKADAEKTASGADTSAKGTAASPDEPVDLQGRPESFWRQTMSDARKQVKELENQTDVLVLQLNDLRNKFYSEDSGFKQQEIQTEINKTLYEQDLVKDKLAKAKDQLSDLEKEARKSGALPGWINP